MDSPFQWRSITLLYYRLAVCPNNSYFYDWGTGVRGAGATGVSGTGSSDLPRIISTRAAKFASIASLLNPGAVD
mgnify:CR=1 FL=1